MTTSPLLPGPPRVSSTSLPVRTDVQTLAARSAPPAGAAQVAPIEGAGAPAAPPSPARRPRTPRPAGPAGAVSRPEPDPEVLEELGRLFWRAVTESDGTPQAAAAVVVEKLRAAKRLGEIATLLGVE